MALMLIAELTGFQPQLRRITAECAPFQSQPQPYEATVCFRAVYARRGRVSNLIATAAAYHAIQLRYCVHCMEEGEEVQVVHRNPAYPAE